MRNPDSLAEKLLGNLSSLNINHASVRALGLSYEEAMGRGRRRSHRDSGRRFRLARLSLPGAAGGCQGVRGRSARNAGAEEQRFLDLIKDEPWVFGIPVGGERAFLSDTGLELREALTIGGEDSIRRYATKADGTQVGAQALAEAMARMAQRAREAGPSSAEAQAISTERMREQQRTMAYQLAEAVVR